MKIVVSFVFLPTNSVLEAAARVGEKSLVEPSVWTTYETDRIGLAHSQEEVEAAFWSTFRAQLFYDNETEGQRLFREQCNALGFDGCWSVVTARGGGSADDLASEAASANEFLKRCQSSSR